MGSELLQFLTAHATVVILAIVVLATVGLVQWRKARVAELELGVKKDLLDQGAAIADVDRLLASRGPAPRGLLEQFGGLSGGAKAGLVIGSVLVATMMCALISESIRECSPHSFPNPAPVTPGSPGDGALPSSGAGEGAGQGLVFYIDLQPGANQKLDRGISGDEGNTLAGLFRGRQQLGGVLFQVGPDFIRLRGKNRPELPGEVKGLRVGLALDRLHFLHAAEFGERDPFLEKDGVEIGRYLVHYADSSVQAVPIVYGEEVRDYWKGIRAGDVKRGQVAWTGANASAGRYGASLRLYRSTWENPRPGMEVTQIEFTSAGGTAASPFCVAITAERNWP